MTAKTLLAALAMAIALPALSLPGFAHDFAAGPLTIGHPYIVATPRTAKSAAGYFSVTNTGTEPDTLTGFESDPEGTLHQTTTEGGVTKMSAVEGGLTIAPGETLTLRPRGTHVMFMGLTKPFLVGETLPAKLTFEKAGTVDVEFNVQSRADSSGHATGTPTQGDAAPGAEATPAENGTSHEQMGH